MSISPESKNFYGYSITSIFGLSPVKILDELQNLKIKSVDSNIENMLSLVKYYTDNEMIHPLEIAIVKNKNFEKTLRKHYILSDETNTSFLKTISELKTLNESQHVCLLRFSENTNNNTLFEPITLHGEDELIDINCESISNEDVKLIKCELIDDTNNFIESLRISPKFISESMSPRKLFPDSPRTCDFDDYSISKKKTIQYNKPLKRKGFFKCSILMDLDVY